MKLGCVERFNIVLPFKRFIEIVKLNYSSERTWCTMPTNINQIDAFIHCTEFMNHWPMISSQFLHQYRKTYITHKSLNLFLFYIWTLSAPYCVEHINSTSMSHGLVRVGLVLGKCWGFKKPDVYADIKCRLEIRRNYVFCRKLFLKFFKVQNVIRNAQNQMLKNCC